MLGGGMGLTASAEQHIGSGRVGLPVAVTVRERRGIREAVQSQVLDHAHRSVDRFIRAATATAARPRRLDRTDQRIGFIDQGDVALAPGRVRDLAVATTVQQRDLFVGQQIAEPRNASAR